MTDYYAETHTFQIRHRVYGILQGVVQGYCFWHPSSDVPQLGFCECPTYELAKEFILLACSDMAGNQLNYFDFSIEIFDREQSDRIIRNAICPV